MICKYCEKKFDAYQVVVPEKLEDDAILTVHDIEDVCTECTCLIIETEYILNNEEGYEYEGC